MILYTDFSSEMKHATVFLFFFFLMKGRRGRGASSRRRMERGRKKESAH